MFAVCYWNLEVRVLSDASYLKEESFVCQFAINKACNCKGKLTLGTKMKEQKVMYQTLKERKKTDELSSSKSMEHDFGAAPEPPREFSKCSGLREPTPLKPITYNNRKKLARIKSVYPSLI